MSGKITVVGIGPGADGHITPLARKTISSAEAVVGYRYYFGFIEHLIPKGCERIEKDLTEESERAKIALRLAGSGKNVVVISSGDSGVYGMASVVCETAARGGASAEVSVVPGVSAFVAAAAKLGAPLGHDFCSISLSDLLVPWEVIETRIRAAAAADFVTVVHNPRSSGRKRHLTKLREIFLESRDPSTPVGVARQVSREDENVSITTLRGLRPENIDMFSVLIIGNSSTFHSDRMLITPRDASGGNPASGTEIMDESFRRINSVLESRGPQRRSEAERRAMERCVHATADFEYEALFHSSPEAVETWSRMLRGGEIVTDVTMVKAGISKALLEETGARVFCYLDDPRALEIAGREKLTRSQAGIRVAVSRHPDALFVVGNAPTALLEVADAVASKSLRPLGVVAAPVGFVNVAESKTRFEAVAGNVPFVLIRGKKGGSGVAAAIVNAALSFNGKA